MISFFAMNNKKINNVRKRMKESGISQLIVSDPYNILYLTDRFLNFENKFLVFVIKENDNDDFLFTHKEIDLDVNKIIYKEKDDYIYEFAKYIDNKKTTIDPNFKAQYLLKILKEKNITDIHVDNILKKCRLVKTPEEIKFMRESSNLNDLIMDELVKNIYLGATELEISKIIFDIKNKYCVKSCFESIIAFESSASDPHHEPSNNYLKNGDTILLDIGFLKNNYCSDMTRTFFMNSVSDFKREIYNLVLDTNTETISKIKPGVKFSELDKIARNCINNKGYLDFFIHKTGHSIGLEVHEYCSVYDDNDEILEPGMIFSIEPGIYFKNKFGVRIEDLVLVTESGCEILNNYDKNLVILNN
jgi:Xaa-Pro dipeptidase